MGFLPSSLKCYDGHASHSMPFLLLHTVVRACGWISMEGDCSGQPVGLEGICAWLHYPGFSILSLLLWYPKRSFNRKHVRTLIFPTWQLFQEKKEEKWLWNQLFRYSPSSEQWVSHDLGRVPVPQLVSCWGGRGASAAATFLAFAQGRLWQVTQLCLEAGFLM